MNPPRHFLTLYPFSFFSSSLYLSSNRKFFPLVLGIPISAAGAGQQDLHSGPINNIGTCTVRVSTFTATILRYSGRGGWGGAGRGGRGGRFLNNKQLIKNIWEGRDSHCDIIFLIDLGARTAICTPGSRCCVERATTLDCAAVWTKTAHQKEPRLTSMFMI